MAAELEKSTAGATIEAAALRKSNAAVALL
jgi:hypothetical protein